MIIENTKTKVITIANVHFMPGVNIFNEEQEKLLTKGIEDVERFIDLKIFKSHDKDPSKTTKNILELSSKDAIELIKEMYNVVVLEKILDQESENNKPRINIIRAIEKQINVIREEKIDKDEDKE